MLNSLEVKNFRLLEDFKVEKLGRVNLIVGKNNSGKSTVLEALRIYAGNGRQELLEEIAAEHDEKFQLDETGGTDLQAVMPFEDFFTFRHFPNDEKSIAIGELGNKEQTLYIQHIFLQETEESVEDDAGISRTHIRRHIVTSPSIDNNFDSRIIEALLVEKGDRRFIVDFNAPRSRFRLSSEKFSGLLPCSIVPTQFISIDELAKEWDRVVFTEHENIVKQAMRVILDDFENIAFVENNDRRSPAMRHPTRGNERTAKVQLRDLPRPVPLNSLGDGMLRVLQLTLKIFSAKNGILLIDEFENGLHYSTQEKIWTLLFEIAEKLNIQVFATTHSWDCIESFAKVAKNNETTEGVLFRVGKGARKSNYGQVIATVFDKDELYNITQADVEVR